VTQPVEVILAGEADRSCHGADMRMAGVNAAIDHGNPHAPVAAAPKVITWVAMRASDGR